MSLPKENRSCISTKPRHSIVPDDKNVHKGKEVVCITDGMLFKSAVEAAKYYDIGYQALNKHLLGKNKSCGCGTGAGNRYKKADGLVFSYVRDLAYKADDVAKHIIDLRENNGAEKDYRVRTRFYDRGDGLYDISINGKKANIKLSLNDILVRMAKAQFDDVLERYKIENEMSMVG